MYLPALPSMVSDLKISTHYAQMTLTAWFLGTASLQLLLGPVSDRIGRKPVLLGGGIIFVTSTIVCAMAPNIGVLLLARFFQGFSVCTIGTAGYSSIHESFDQRKVIHLLAIMGSITVLAPAFGPLAGGLILNFFSWRWIFGILAIWASLALLFLWRWMPETNPKEKRHVLDWRIITRNYRSIFLNPRFTLNILIVCCNFVGIIAWIAAGPFLVIDKFNLSILDFGIFQVMVFGSLIVGAQVVKYAIKTISANSLIKLGLAISLIGSILAVVSAVAFPHFLLGLVITLMIFTFGSSLVFGPAQRIAIESCVEPMGARMAIFSSLMSFFGFVGGLLVSLTYTGTLLWVASLFLIISIAACFLKMLCK